LLLGILYDFNSRNSVFRLIQSRNVFLNILLDVINISMQFCTYQPTLFDPNNLFQVQSKSSYLIPIR